MLWTKTKKEDTDYTIVLGCGRLGANLATILSGQNRFVLVIDKDIHAFRKLPPSFKGYTLVGDATDLNVLQKAKIETATAIVAVTNNDNLNIMLSQMAQELFSIEHVIASLYDPEHECVYQEFGIDTVCPASLSAREIDHILTVTKQENQNVCKEQKS